MDAQNQRILLVRPIPIRPAAAIPGVPKPPRELCHKSALVRKYENTVVSAWSFHPILKKKTNE